MDVSLRVKVRHFMLIPLQCAVLELCLLNLFSLTLKSFSSMWLVNFSTLSILIGQIWKETSSINRQILTSLICCGNFYVSAFPTTISRTCKNMYTVHSIGQQTTQNSISCYWVIDLIISVMEGPKLQAINCNTRSSITFKLFLYIPLQF